MLDDESSSLSSSSLQDAPKFLSVHSSSSIWLRGSSWSEDMLPVDRFENSILSGVCTKEDIGFDRELVLVLARTLAMLSLEFQYLV